MDLFTERSVIHKQGGQQQDDANQHQAQTLELAGHSPACDGQNHAQNEKQHDQHATQSCMFFPKVHIVTLAFQTADSHALGQILLDADIQDQNRKHDQHQTGIHGAILCGRLLCLHQIQQTCGQSPLVLVGDQSLDDDVLIPEGQEIEQDNGNDGGLCHGENNLQHGPGIAGTVDVGCLLEVVGQSGKVAGQQINGEGQRGGRVDNRHHNVVIQQEGLAQDTLMR